MKKTVMSVIGTLMIFATGSLGFSADKKASVNLTASGSSALFPLVKDAADKYKAVNPSVSITVNAGGSGTGLAQVSDGSVDIGNSDVAAETKLSAAKAAALTDHKVCVITMAPVINNDIAQTVKSLTKKQLIGIFTAQIKNWKEVGGPDEAILLVTRPTTSGTRAVFKQYALDNNEEASNKSLETDNSGTLLQTVAQNRGAIGYLAISYLLNNSTVSTVAIDGVAPTMENTYTGTYPVWAYEHMYVQKKSKNEKAAQAFISYITGTEYGKLMEAQGYCVTSKMKVTR
jgi:phosphate transport system substrate-binding protein